MEPLAKLFGNPTRLKLLRLFFFNDEFSFTPKEAAFRTKTSKQTARKELTLLHGAGVIKKRTGKGADRTLYGVNKSFPHYQALQMFLRNSTEVSDAKILATLKKAGALRAIVLSGIFASALEPKIDILVVADKLDERALSSAVHALEAELGRELRYAYFTTDEFKYRVGVYDRLVRDVFDYSHRIILDRMGLG